MTNKETLVLLDVIIALAFILGAATIGTTTWMGLGWFAIAGGSFYARRGVSRDVQDENSITKK